MCKFFIPVSVIAFLLFAPSFVFSKTMNQDFVDSELLSGLGTMIGGLEHCREQALGMTEMRI